MLSCICLLTSFTQPDSRSIQSKLESHSGEPAQGWRSHIVYHGFVWSSGNTRLGAKCSELSQETHVLILTWFNNELGDGGWEIPSVGTEFLSARYGGEKGLWDVYHLFQVLGPSHKNSSTPLLSLIAQGPPHWQSTSVTDHVKPCHWVLFTMALLGSGFTQQFTHLECFNVISCYCRLNPEIAQSKHGLYCWALHQPLMCSKTVLWEQERRLRARRSYCSSRGSKFGF